MEKPNVLFLCTGNSCRSQMAEGFLRHYGGDRFNVVSAGLEPRPVHPLAVRVMLEAGVDIGAQRSKGVREVLGRESFGYAIFVCAEAERNCPRIFPFAVRSLSWHFEDPAAFVGPPQETLARFRAVRDRIERRIRQWLVELDAGGEPPAAA